MFVIYVVIVLLAGGLIWSELRRRKEKELLTAKLSDEHSHLGVGELVREIDPSTQDERSIVSEGYDMEKEIRLIAEKKEEYRKILSATDQEKSIGLEQKENAPEQLTLKRKYDDAF